MNVKVSVVVPVYNPGKYIDACIDSLLRQSLPADEYELIFVDDGSTDGTEILLDELAASFRNVQTIHIPNSGWPGRPRNMGTDASRGEFVYYVDNDDWVGEQALERMYKAACRFQSDVLIGKVVGHGKGVPKELFRATKERADIFDDALLTLLTPAKLFRRSFLDKYGIRYPEGKVRLEDHYFVIQAYLQAEVISVLASYPCYHWMRRAGGNASSDHADPHVYYNSLRRVLDIVDTHVPPGPDRDRFYAHWYRSKMLKPVSRQRILTALPGYAARRYTEVRKLALDRMSSTVDEHLSPSMRARSALLRADRRKDLFALAEADRGVRADVCLDDVRWEKNSLRLRVSGRLLYGDGSPVLFGIEDGRMCWRVPVPLDTRLPPATRDAGTALTEARLDVLVTDRASGCDYHLPIVVEQTQTKLSDGTVELALRGEARLEPMSALAGEPLTPGFWNLTARISCGGWSSFARLGSKRADHLGTAVRPRFFDQPVGVVSPYWTAGNGNLSLSVGRISKALRRTNPDLSPKPEPAPVKKPQPPQAANSGVGNSVRRRAKGIVRLARRLRDRSRAKLVQVFKS